MPLPLTVSCFSKIQIGFTFLMPAHPASPGKRAVKRVFLGRFTPKNPVDFFGLYPCNLKCTVCIHMTFVLNIPDSRRDWQYSHQCTCSGVTRLAAWRSG